MGIDLQLSLFSLPSELLDRVLYTGLVEDGFVWERVGKMAMVSTAMFNHIQKSFLRHILRNHYGDGLKMEVAFARHLLKPQYSIQLENLDLAIHKIGEGSSGLKQDMLQCCFHKLHIEEGPDAKFMSDSFMEDIARKSTNLSALHLIGNSQLTDAGLRQISLHCHKLQELVLDKLPVSDIGISEVTKNLKNLSSLELSLTKSTERALESISCNSHESLRSLNLIHAGRFLPERLEFLTSCKKLNSFKLLLECPLSLTDALLGNLSDSWQEMKDLQLRSAKKITVIGIEKLIKNCSQLENLTFDNFILTPEALSIILIHGKKLRKLCFDRSCVAQDSSALFPIFMEHGGIAKNLSHISALAGVLDLDHSQQSLLKAKYPNLKFEIKRPFQYRYSLRPL